MIFRASGCRNTVLRKLDRPPCQPSQFETIGKPISWNTPAWEGACARRWAIVVINQKEKIASKRGSSSVQPYLTVRNAGFCVIHPTFDATEPFDKSMMYP
jgi:hypothetical protein